MKRLYEIDMNNPVCPLCNQDLSQMELYKELSESPDIVREEIDIYREMGKVELEKWLLEKKKFYLDEVRKIYHDIRNPLMKLDCHAMVLALNWIYGLLDLFDSELKKPSVKQRGIKSEIKSLQEFLSEPIYSNMISDIVLIGNKKRNLTINALASNIREKFPDYSSANEILNIIRNDFKKKASKPSIYPRK